MPSGPNPVQVAGITDLPAELLLQILEHVDNAGLCALGSTCRYLNTLAFSFFFEKHKATDPSSGWLCCYGAPQHTLRAARCNLAFKKITNIHWYFNKGLDRLLEEVEDMGELVKKKTSKSEFTDFRVFMVDPDQWALSDVLQLDAADIPPLTENEWTDRYLGLLTNALKKGCQRAYMSGGDQLLNYLRVRDVKEGRIGGVGPGITIARYFDGNYRRNVVSLKLVDNPTFHGSKRMSLPGLKGRRNGSRFFKWVDIFSKKNKRGARLDLEVDISRSSQNVGPSSGPTPQDLALGSDVFFANPSFLDWTYQLLSWCAPTLTHLRLNCPETTTAVWIEFFSEVTLPFLTSFAITRDLVVGSVNTQGSDVLGFLSRHPSIQRLTLHGIQVPHTLSDLPEAGRHILPHLTEVTAHPLYIRWLLRDKKQCPKLKEATVLTEYYARIYLPNLLTSYDQYNYMDATLKALLPHSSKLDVLAFRFTDDHSELDEWLHSHVNAAQGFMGRSKSILTKFVHTKHLRINSAHYVSILDSPTRLDLVAQFVGMFPKVEFLEMLDQPGAAYGETQYVEPMLEALRMCCPQVRKVKVNINHPIDVATGEVLSPKFNYVPVVSSYY